jgi:hypothetical protein
MNNTRFCTHLARALCAAVTGLAALSATADTTNWVAYNDHTPGTTAGWATHPNATTYNMRGVSGGNAGTVLSGNLKDTVTGNSVGAIFTSTANGTPNDFGSSAYPNAGTPAYNLFNGYVDLGNNQSMIGLRATSATPASQQILTFSNLDPNKRYVLKGTAIRGNNYLGRWTLASLQGVEGFTDDHTAEVYTSANFPGGGMTNGQAGWHSGENRANGAVAGWKDINPGADGTFNVFLEQWTVNPLPNGSAPDLANYGYGFCGIMVAEVEVGAPQPPLITVEPIGVTTNEGAVARLTVAASGSGSLTYQWYRNGTAIPGALGSSLTVTNMNGLSPYPWSRPSDSGNYRVVVTGAENPPATSQVATVTINADAVAPQFSWALVETNIVRILLSEPLGNPLLDYGDQNANLYWTTDPVSGPGPSFGAPDDVRVTNGEIHLIYSGPLVADPQTSYKVIYDSGNPLYDRAETPNNMASTQVPLHIHEAQALAFDDSWKYSDLDLPAPAGWQLPGFNDSDTSFWKSGSGPFDAKRGTTGCRTTSEVNFELPPIGTCIAITNLPNTNNIFSYYFRTRFAYNGQVQSNIMIRLKGKFDDGGVVFLNGTEIARVGIDATNSLSHSNYNSNRTVGNDAPDTAIIIPVTALQSGENVVAVYLAQLNATSSDVTMGLRMITVTTSPVVPAVARPRLSIAPSGSDLSISWTPAGGKLVSGPTISGPWTTNDTPTNPTLVTPSSGQRYFFITE